MTQRALQTGSRGPETGSHPQSAGPFRCRILETMTTTAPQGPEFYALGRLLNHDERSRNFPAPRATRRKPLTHRIMGAVLDQGTLGSCTGNAAAAALNSVKLHKKGTHLFAEPDAVQFYSVGTKLDPFDGTYPPEDTGSSGLAVAQGLKAAGLISSYTHAFGLDHLLDALQLAPVMIGIPWHQSMFYPDSKGFVTPDGNVVGGHEVCVRGDDNKTSVLVRNSWSRQWGLNGDFRMTYATLATLLADDGDATVLVR